VYVCVCLEGDGFLNGEWQLEAGLE
jgi:hypothetical protein